MLFFKVMCCALNTLVIHLLVAFKAHYISPKHNQGKVLNASFGLTVSIGINKSSKTPFYHIEHVVFY